MKPIKIKVIPTKEDIGSNPFEMTISDPMDITAYLYRDPTLIFNYRGELYKAYNMTEREFITICPHLNK